MDIQKKYKVLLLTGGGILSEQLSTSINRLKNDDSVISSDSEIEVLTECDNDGEIDVFVGIGGDEAKEARCRSQEAKKPALLCDIGCSQKESYDPATVPYTWGLFSKNNKEMEKDFLKHYNLSFVYAANENLLDYVAPLVFHLLEEFSYHSKYNTDFGYKKQAEFIHEFTQFYLDKMKQLVNAKGFVRDDIKGDFYHIIYRYRPKNANEPFKSIDGRDYDFIIEYHRGKPSEGIYYGVKGEVQKGDLEKQCEQFRQEWPCIFMKEHKDRENLTDLQKVTTDILNDTFLWKDFLKCYKPTDNFNKKRYWLFWITLNDDEDIISVARLAVKLMSRTFKYYLWGNDSYVDREKKDEETEQKKGRGRPKKTDKRNDNYLRIPYFSNEAYTKLCDSYDDGRKKTIIKNWIEKLKNKEIIKKDRMYEKCYRLQEIDWNVFIDNYVKSSNNDKGIKSPFEKSCDDTKKGRYHYDLLVRLFLPKDGIRMLGNDRPK